MPKLSRKWAPLVGGVLAIACTIFFVQQVTPLLAGDGLELGQSLQLLPPALAVFMLAYAAFAFGWHFLLLTVGTNPPVATSIGVFATTQFGKYLPGNVGHHIGRVALASRMGLPVRSVVATMAAEILVVLAWMFLLGLPLLDFWAARLDIDGMRLALVAASAMFLTLAGAGLLYAFFRKRPAVASTLASLREMATHASGSPGKASTAIVLILTGILATSFSLALLDPTWSLPSPQNFPIVAGLFAAAWLLGFVTPGAPAGIGVREVVLTEGLTPLIGREQSIAVSLMFRILSTGTDLLVFLSGLGILWWQRTRLARHARSQAR